MIGRRLILALALVLTSAACEPTFSTTTPSTPCYEGTFSLQAEQFTAPVETAFGSVSITLLTGPSMSLTLSNGTYTLTGTEQVSVTGAFTGQATVQGTASGTYTATSTTIDFVVTSLSGTVTVVGTYNGHTVNETIDISTLGLEELVGLQGQATYTCGTDGLSLTFTALHLDF